jgi:hypothetical protein
LLNQRHLRMIRDLLEMVGSDSDLGPNGSGDQDYG